ncbi:MAG: YceI family protein [Armatimonadota bacterium]|nr:YceI family protein [Armatimonadota bacterium]MDR7404454.1 YceI family protein [Armatimonadota bacterium]MDR7506523.1 YceI family protein [Armatimonadota bacterium]
MMTGARRAGGIVAAVLVLGSALAGGAGVSGAAAPAAVQRFVLVPGESQALYRVGETLFREGNRFNVAVGVTTAVRGEILVDRASPANSRVGPIQVDISQLRSDSPRRDAAIRERWLESARFPTAEFTSTRIDGLPARYEDGREVSLRVTGDLKIREVVRPVTFAATVRLTGQELRGVATARILMTDFGFEPPSILGVLRAQNEVEIEVRFVARPAP